jgi:putative ABC transport system permease protein
LSLVLLVGALLFTRSLRNLSTVDAGFRAEGVLSVSLDLRTQAYNRERLPAVYRELLSGMTALPGVLSGAQINFTPISGSGWNNSIGVDGVRAEGSGKESFFNSAGPGYFKTMGASLVAGRDFDTRDTVGSPRVAIVNREFARRFFNGANPIGHTFRRDAPAGQPEDQYEIIGLVENMKYHQLREDPIPTAFVAAGQDAEPGSRVTFVLRSAGPVSDLLTNVKQSIARTGPAIGIEFRFLSQQIANSLLRDRLMATLSGAFGMLGGLLATLGLYGVISYMVARRRNEIGIRVALGADRVRVVRMVLKEAAALLAAGLAIGALLAFWAGRAATPLLFGLPPHDPLTMALAMLLLAGVALAASYAPARRAAALEPMAALREE